MSRLRAMTVKEFWALLRDPRGRLSLIMPPILQLLLFSFAATLEVKNVEVAFLDLSGGTHSREIVSRVAASPNFRSVRRLEHMDELRSAVDRQEVIAVLVFEPGFDADVEAGRGRLGIILDGRRANASQIVAGYLGAIAGEVGLDSVDRSDRDGARAGSVVRNWFNPNLDFLWFNLPALACLIVSVSALSITAQAISRERELGTFDQLMVSPLRQHEILIGKMIPPFVLSILNGSLFVVAAPLFGVPFTGSLLLFYFSLSFYTLALIGFGMMVSGVARTQQQAFLGSFVVTVPIVMLSGFATPIDNMPEWLQVLTYGVPARYFLEVSIGLFLKDMSFADVLRLTWPMILLSVLAVGASAWLFRARSE